MKTDINEAIRYMMANNDPQLYSKTVETAMRLEAEIEPRYIYRVFEIERDGNGARLKGTDIALQGTLSERMLSECSKVAVMLCTLGFDFDSMLRTEQARNMPEALRLDACGSAYVEAVCNEAEAEIAELFPGKYLTDRFSPGYGDIPLRLQTDICRILNAEKRLGVHLTDSMLMNPCKTVTAFVGISDVPQRARIRDCKYCTLREHCELRKDGKSCAE